jgi:hypothetical protein
MDTEHHRFLNLLLRCIRTRIREWINVVHTPRLKQATLSVSERTGFPQREDIYKGFVSQFREFLKNWDAPYTYIAVCFDF